MASGYSTDDSFRLEMKIARFVIRVTACQTKIAELESVLKTAESLELVLMHSPQHVFPCLRTFIECCMCAVMKRGTLFF